MQVGLSNRPFLVVRCANGRVFPAILLTACSVEQVVVEARSDIGLLPRFGVCCFDVAVFFVVVVKANSFQMVFKFSEQIELCFVGRISIRNKANIVA